MLRAMIIGLLFKCPLIVFKFKRKTGYKKTQGHRQRYTRLKIKTISQKKAKSETKTNSKDKKSSSKATKV